MQPLFLLDVNMEPCPISPGSTGGVEKWHWNVTAPDNELDAFSIET